MKLNDVIELNKRGAICTTYPLNEFRCYLGEERNNNIQKGMIIEAKKFCFMSGMHSLLIKDFETDRVCVYRTYNNEFQEKLTHGLKNTRRIKRPSRR